MKNSFFNQRRAGVLLHPTSLPGGDIGHDAWRFIEFLQECGFSLWQMLPLGPTHEDGSPYQSLSAHAGNPLLISLDWLSDRGWLQLDEKGSSRLSREQRLRGLATACLTFSRHATADWKQKLSQFRTQNQYWLPDYALFMSIKKSQHGKPWTLWPNEVRNRQPQAMKRIAKELATDIAYYEFEQFIFFSQWHEVRQYARQHGVMMFGDVPIFVAHDSADVWACRHNFLLDDHGEPLWVAGVPPDAFSETGQRWGNPLYDWAAMRQHHYDWWLGRFKTQQALFDLIRIDHFRGFEACWQIPATETTAIAGNWVQVPGRELLQAVNQAFPQLALVAEDLGVITAAVDDLRRDFALPGMKILQFAFGGGADNPYLPHNHENLSVVYTGTHDNDTTSGWIQSSSESVIQHLKQYAACEALNETQMLHLMQAMAMSSVAQLAILPLQDILELGTQHRMNTPGTLVGNWSWRFDWQLLQPEMKQRMQMLLQRYGRFAH